MALEWFVFRALTATCLKNNLKILDAGDITNTGVVLDDPNSTASSDLSLRFESSQMFKFMKNYLGNSNWCTK